MGSFSSPLYPKQPSHRGGNFGHLKLDEPPTSPPRWRRYEKTRHLSQLWSFFSGPRSSLLVGDFFTDCTVINHHHITIWGTFLIFLSWFCLRQAYHHGIFIFHTCKKTCVKTTRVIFFYDGAIVVGWISSWKWWTSQTVAWDSSPFFHHHFGIHGTWKFTAGTWDEHHPLWKLKYSSEPNAHSLGFHVSFSL